MPRLTSRGPEDMTQSSQLVQTAKPWREMTEDEMEVEVRRRRALRTLRATPESKAAGVRKPSTPKAGPAFDPKNLA